MAHEIVEPLNFGRTRCFFRSKLWSVFLFFVRAFGIFNVVKTILTMVRAYEAGFH